MRLRSCPKRERSEQNSMMRVCRPMRGSMEPR
jgi:hypothetical protein